MFIDGLAHPAVTRLADSTLYPAAADTGRTPFDLPPGRTRALRSDGAPLTEFLEHLASPE